MKDLNYRVLNYMTINRIHDTIHYFCRNNSYRLLSSPTAFISSIQERVRDEVVK